MFLIDPRIVMAVLHVFSIAGTYDLAYDSQIVTDRKTGVVLIAFGSYHIALLIRIMSEPDRCIAAAEFKTQFLDDGLKRAFYLTCLLQFIHYHPRRFYKILISAHGYVPLFYCRYDRPLILFYNNSHH